MGILTDQPIELHINELVIDFAVLQYIRSPIFLTVQADLTLRLGDAVVQADALGAALDQASAGDREQRVFLRADKSVSYGDLMQAMDNLRGAGYLKVALVGLEHAVAP